MQLWNRRLCESSRRRTNHPTLHPGNLTCVPSNRKDARKRPKVMLSVTHETGHPQLSNWRMLGHPSPACQLGGVVLTRQKNTPLVRWFDHSQPSCHEGHPGFDWLVSKGNPSRKQERVPSLLYAGYAGQFQLQYWLETKAYRPRFMPGVHLWAHAFGHCGCAKHRRSK